MKAYSKFTLILAAILCPMMANLTGCTASPATGAMQLILISESQEIAMGAQAAPELAKQFGGPVNSPLLQNYVKQVGEKVSAHAERDMPWEFTLVYSDVPNAFALPGGKIFITAGLMQSMTHERQLAAVLGHEIGHVTDRHSILNLERQLGIALLAELAAMAAGDDYKDLARAGTAIAGNFANLSYSRGQEYTADELGLRYLYMAGYNPVGMIELLQILQDKSSGKDSAWTEMLRTHPLTDNRIEKAESIVGSQYPVDSQLRNAPNPMERMVKELEKSLKQYEIDKKSKPKNANTSENPKQEYPAASQ